MSSKKVHVYLEENVTLTCNATGDNIKYEWTNGSGSFDYGRVSGVYNNTLVIIGVTLSDGNTYTCMASNEGGSVTSSVTLIVTGTNV